MDDLIKRQDAITAYCEHECGIKGMTRENCGAADCGTIFDDIPSADVRENVSGEWEEIEVIAEAYDISGVKTWASKMKCDQCGFTTIAIEGHFSQYNFCPNCGAEMER